MRGKLHRLSSVSLGFLIVTLTVRQTAAQTPPVRSSSVSPSNAEATPSACDKSLIRRAVGAFGYAVRGSGCEGIYAAEVSGTVLRLASFTGYVEKYELKRGKDLYVDWPAAVRGRIHIQAQSIKRNLYYQMDVVRDADSIPYRWSTQVLVAQNIAAENIGVTARTRRVVAGVERDVYMPLVVRQGDKTVTDGQYTVVLYPTVRVAELFITLARLDDQGKLASYVLKDSRKSCRYCGAEEPISIPIVGIDQPGLYSVEIGARLANGEATALRHWLWLPGTELHAPR